MAEENKNRRLSYYQRKKFAKELESQLATCVGDGDSDSLSDSDRDVSGEEERVLVVGGKRRGSVAGRR